MDITDLKIQIIIVLAGVAALWVLFKALKWAWRIGVVVLIFFGLSFILPAMRKWAFSLF